MAEDDGAAFEGIGAWMTWGIEPSTEHLRPMPSCDFEGIFGGSVETWLTTDTLDEADRDGAMP